MTLPVVQSFLPIVTSDNRVLGIQSISTTKFTGSENQYGGTSASPNPGVQGGVVNLTLVQAQALNGPMTLAIDGAPAVTATVNLTGISALSQIPGIIQTAFPGLTATYVASPETFALASATNSPSSGIVVTTTAVATALGLTTATGASNNAYVAPTGGITIKLYSPKANLGLPPQDQLSVNYMGIPVTLTQERQGNYGPSWLQPFIPYTRWRQQPGFARYDWKGNSLVELLQGQPVDAITTPSTGTTTAVDGTLTIVWSVDFNTGDQYAFFDANWVSLFSASSGNTNAASISIGNPTQDPSGGMIKLFLLNVYPVIVNQSILFNTIRFVKITNDNIPAGTYIWPAVISNTDDSTVNVTLTVTVV